jgi:quercetin dioxygenase-like cupin family protein
MIGGFVCARKNHCARDGGMSRCDAALWLTATTDTMPTRGTGHPCVTAADVYDRRKQPMLDKPIVNKFAHTKPGDTPWVSDGLRSFFQYRDLGIAEATGGRVIAQLVRAIEAPEKGTGWHQHTADFHIVIMLKGWARFMYEDKEHLVAAGDCVHQRPGITHFLFDYSPDMEYLEVVGPADFGTVDVDGPAPVPNPTPWK